jgi:peptide/nickel transport system ATP-binding protein
MPPTPETIPAGCAFAPRCAYARPACGERPPLRKAGHHEAHCVLEEAERAALRHAALPEEMPA